jgi:hypothetical protein
MKKLFKNVILSLGAICIVFSFIFSTTYAQLPLEFNTDFSLLGNFESFGNLKDNISTTTNDILSSDVVGLIDEIANLTYPESTSEVTTSCTDEPCENPPLGNVIPTFSGLFVEGPSKFTGEVEIDPDDDGEYSINVNDSGNIIMQDPDNNQHVNIWEGLNLLDLKSDGLISLNSPWIIIDATTLDIQNATHGTSDLEVNIDGYLNADRIGSYYNKFINYNSAEITTNLNTLATPECENAGEYAVSYWYNITDYSTTYIDDITVLGVERVYNTESVPIGYTLRLYNKYGGVNDIDVGVTCFAASGYRPAGGEKEITTP